MAKVSSAKLINELEAVVSSIKAGAKKRVRLSITGKRIQTSFAETRVL